MEHVLSYPKDSKPRLRVACVRKNPNFGRSSLYGGYMIKPFLAHMFL